MSEGIVLVVRVTMTDDSDLEWMRNRIIPAVEEILVDNVDRLDGQVGIEWDTEDMVIPL